MSRAGATREAAPATRAGALETLADPIGIAIFTIAAALSVAVSATCAPALTASRVSSLARSFEHPSEWPDRLRIRRLRGCSIVSAKPCVSGTTARGQKRG
jgi:hypothetical protein